MKPCLAALIMYALRRNMHWNAISRLMEAGLHPRILILTDGEGTCDPGKLGAQVGNRAFGTGTAILDVIALGMKDAAAEKYSEAVGQARGVFMKVDQPEDLPLVVSRYLRVLNQPVRRPLVVLGGKPGMGNLARRCLESPRGELRDCPFRQCEIEAFKRSDRGNQGESGRNKHPKPGDCEGKNCRGQA